MVYVYHPTFGHVIFYDFHVHFYNIIDSLENRIQYYLKVITDKLKLRALIFEIFRTLILTA